MPSPPKATLRRERNAVKAEPFAGMWDVTNNVPQPAMIRVGPCSRLSAPGRGTYSAVKKKGRHE